MRVAIVGAGPTGLAAARLLSEDPRHVISVFETRAWFGGPVDHLSRLGVTLRRTAQVERLAADDAGADLWIHGLPERFDLALVTTSAAEARALLARSGIRREARLRGRVYFADQGAEAALLRMAGDHPALRPRPCVPAPPRIAVALRSLARRAGELTAARVRYLDLSGHTWPLTTPAIYIANQQWVLAVVRRHLMVPSLRTPEASCGASDTAGQLEAGGSVAFVVREQASAAPHGRGAALASLATNAPLVPIAADRRSAASRRRAKACVVIGEPFYPETSSIDELIDDMCTVVGYLERLAIEFALDPLPT